MPRIRVFLADDHTVLRAGLRALLSAQADMDVVGEAGAELFVPRSGGRIVPNAAMARGAATNVYVTVHGSVTSERDLAMAVRDQLVRYTRRNGGSPLGNFG